MVSADVLRAAVATEDCRACNSGGGRSYLDSNPPDGAVSPEANGSLAVTET